MLLHNAAKRILVLELATTDISFSYIGLPPAVEPLDAMEHVLLRESVLKSRKP